MCFLTISLISSIAAGTSIAATLGSIGSAVGATGGLATAVGAGAVAAEVIGIGASVGGGIVSTIGGIQQQKAMAAQAEYQADIEEKNAQMASQSAEANELQANQKRLALFNQMQQMQGHVRTDFAGRGVMLGSGTPTDYEADLADAYDMDKKNLNYDTATRTWQYRVQAAGHQQQADLYRAQAKGARSLIPGTVAGGLLSTAGNAMQAGLTSFSLGTELGLFGKGAGDTAAKAAGGTLSPYKPWTWGQAR